MGLESASFLNGLVTTNPVSGDGVAQGDDHFRLLKAVLKASFPNITAARYLEQARADAADSATPALWAAATNYVNLLGTTTITGFDSGVSGQWKLVRFDGARQLTHHATTLDLPNSANITTVAGDHALVLNRGITSNIIVAYYRATGKALVETDQFPSSPAQGDIVYRNASSWVRLAAGTSGHVLRTQGAAANPIWAAETAIPVADQAGMEAASSTSTFVTPGRQHFHPGHPKAGGNFDGTGTPAFRSGDYGMGAVTDNGTGSYTLNLDTAFSNANYWCATWANTITGQRNVLTDSSVVKTTSSMEFDCGTANLSSVDTDNIYVTFWGDYA